MGPPFYVPSVFDRNVVMRRIPVYSSQTLCFVIEKQLRVSAYSKLFSDCIQLYKEKNAIYCLYIIVFSLKMARYEPKRVGAIVFLCVCV